ncbi:ribosomal protein S5 domain 2-type protein [Dioszegia hungarica]|uniref:Ribosomal RNA-processing protein 43 n=1 Tax=Dioszegia hungarica TaxID=4972 RepID=A0AA38LSU6_9TREE|nr:ribosomal protein S5 domain 2-type protein [Dioszegia hungarica]KAI9633658.1 ribosomal protein S5 domain 2-type protein [Dioszegia hungarica]
MAATAALPSASTNAEAGPSAPPAPSAAAAAAVFKRLHPASYLARYLAEGYRADGRKVGEWRDVSVNAGSVSTADGSALVRMGDTTMVCGIKAEIAEPSSAAPTHGYIVPNIDLPALASSRFKPGPPGDEAQVYSNCLNDVIVSSQVLNPASLCISAGHAVWALYIDVVCINYDGNAFDAAVLAVMAALRNTRLPKAVYDPNTNKTTCVRGETYPLSLGRTLLACTFGIFQSKTLLPDPSSFETPLLPTTITIALDEEGTACLVRQEGLGGVVGKTGKEVLGDAWGAAEDRCRALREVLKEST